MISEILTDRKNNLSTLCKVNNFFLYYLSKVETFKTFSRPGITVSRFRILPVARTITHLALSPGYLGVAEIVIRTNVTALAAIARVAVTDGLVGGLVQIAALRVAVPGRLDVRTGTRTAGHLVGPKDRVAIVANLTPSTKSEG